MKRGLILILAGLYVLATLSGVYSTVEMHRLRGSEWVEEVTVNGVKQSRVVSVYSYYTLTMLTGVTAAILLDTYKRAGACGVSRGSLNRDVEEVD